MLVQGLMPNNQLIENALQDHKRHIPGMNLDTNIFQFLFCPFHFQNRYISRLSIPH